MAQWSPIDPDDVVDLWFDWADESKPPEKRFLAEDENIDTSLITVPDGFTKLMETIDGKKVRFRVAPNGAAVGKYDTNCHIVTDSGQEFDMNNTLVIKERAK